MCYESKVKIDLKQVLSACVLKTSAPLKRLRAVAPGTGSHPF